MTLSAHNKQDKLQYLKTLEETVAELFNTF